MEQSKTSAKDFFLHLGEIVALYTIVISFLNVLFKVINYAFPEVTTYYYSYFGGGSEISMPVATLIIVFPIFLILSSLVYKSYAVDENKKHLAVRKWLTYITLFVAGIILVGDLVNVLYKFLDGQDLTTAFLLKALSVLLVTSGVFGYYLQDIRDKIPAGRRKMWAIISGLVVLVSIVLGFSVLGSPQTQRLVRQDNQKITDLQNLQYQVINYWQQNASLPDSMPTIASAYQYKKVSAKSFQLCADFNRESAVRMYQNSTPTIYPEKAGMMTNDDWTHSSGNQCFSRTLDSVAYPIYNRVPAPVQAI